ncbi:MAG: right-handed parallel beta-helix repeat-containing protein, partial [Ignavibacteria bacterium]
MKKIFLFALVVAIAGNTFGIDVSGNQSGTWTLVNSPYHVIGDVTVLAETSLTIEPGVEVKFDLNKRITIFGELQAVGTLSDSIYFQADDISEPWDGIKIENTNVSNLSYCVISDSDDSGITVSSSTGIIIYCSHIYNNTALMGGGINVIEGCTNVTIETCEVNNNQSTSTETETGGGGVAFTMCNLSTVNNCLIHDNTADQYGGGIFLNRTSETSITNDTIIDGNTAAIGGGICIFKGNDNAIINNRIRYNEALGSSSSGAWGGGVYLMTATNICGNYISYNVSRGEGGGIYASNWSVAEKVICNNSIFENQATNQG